MLVKDKGYLPSAWEKRKFCLVGKSNGSRHSVREASDNKGCDLR